MFLIYHFFLLPNKYVNGYGLVSLTKSGQFSNFMEFYKDDVTSY